MRINNFRTIYPSLGNEGAGGAGNQTGGVHCNFAIFFVESDAVFMYALIAFAFQVVDICLFCYLKEAFLGFGFSDFGDFERRRC